MNGAIFVASKYGSTRQYADWIGEACGLPVFDIRETGADPAQFDFVVLASAVLYFRLLIREWAARHLQAFADKPVIVVTVSGAPAGERLDGWVQQSLPPSINERMSHFALRGRQDRSRLSMFDKVMLWIGSQMNPDKESAKHETQGFDFVDRASIAPVVAAVKELQARD